MNSTTLAPALPIVGSQLHGELRTFFQAQHYATTGRREAIEWIEANGTATGCPMLDADDQAEANLIITNRLGSKEYASAADWPAVYDEDAWALSPTPDAAAENQVEESSSSFRRVHSTDALPSDAGDRLREPTAADHIEHASGALVNLLDEGRERQLDELWAQSLIEAGLVSFPAPICGGSPDEKPIRVRWDDNGCRSRRQPGYTDQDHQAAGHAV